MAEILFLAGSEADGCRFYRCDEPARVLRTRGHNATVEVKAGLGTLASADVVVFQRSAETSALEAMRKLAAMKAGRPRMVYELDDDLLSIPHHLGAELHATFGEEARRDRIREAVGLCDMVLTTNQHLAKEVINHYMAPGGTGRIRIVPNYVPERFTRDKIVPCGEVPVIGWAGSATHLADLEPVIVPLRRILRTTTANVLIQGLDITPRLRTATVSNNRALYRAWDTDTAAYLSNLDFDIGIAPLEDNHFNQSKSDIKLKEYAARGIVPVASPVGPYYNSPVPRLEAGEGMAGSWYDELRGLVDTGRGFEVSKHAVLEWAQDNTLEAHAAEWEGALLDD